MKFFAEKKLNNFVFLINFFLFFSTFSFADNHNIYETLEQIQKDIKTLEKAVYSGTLKLENENNTNLTLGSDNN